MNYKGIRKYFLELGASYYNSEDYLLSSYNYKPIGNYGIGFLASYMLSEKIKVKTKFYRDSVMYEVDIDKNDEYVCIRESETNSFSGTEVILEFNDFFEIFDNKESVRSFLKQNFITTQVEITIYDLSDESNIKVENQLEVRNPSYQSVNLSEYLEDIEVEVQYYVNKFEDMFVEYLEDLDYAGEAFIFYNNKLYLLEDNYKKFKIKDFISDNELNVLNFVVIEDSDRLRNLIDVIEDNEEAKELYLSKYNNGEITIIAESELIDYAPEGYENVDEILERLDFKKFEEFGIYHENHEGTFFEIETINFHLYEDGDILLPVKNRYDTRKLNYLRHFNENKLFVRNVFIKNLDIKMNNSLLLFNIQLMSCNIINKQIKPNVSRNNLTGEDEKVILNSIYQALCLCALKNIKNAELKLILIDYLNINHNHEKSFLKSEYKAKIQNKSL